MKTISFITALILFIAIGTAQTDNSEAIALALKTGNAKELSKYFNPNINLKILTQEDVYSKAQAELIIKDFFAKNAPKGYVAKHNGTSKNGAQYTIGQITTANGNFRTYYFLKKTGEAFHIQEFRIETEE